MAFYVESSAAAKLVLDEPESESLEAWMLATAATYISSDLTRTELIRATRRFVPDRMGEARQVLDNLTIISIPTRAFDQAGLIEPSSLRSLDAIHLAAALELGDELDGIVTYDERLADAATQLGVPVVAPA